MLDSYHKRLLSAQLSATWRSDICRLRQLNLQVSISTEIRSCHIGNVTCLSAEGNQDRYLLAGGSDGRISLFDLDTSSAPVTESDKVRCSRIVNCCSVTTPSIPARYISSIQWYPVDMVRVVPISSPLIIKSLCIDYERVSSSLHRWMDVLRFGTRTLSKQRLSSKSATS